MLSVSAPSRTKSSLEEMLESLRQRDENEKPKDCPPALPSRPKLSPRTRPPSPKRTLPKTASDIRDVESESVGKKTEKRNMFGGKKMESSNESPYVNSSCFVKDFKHNFWEKDGAKGLPYSLPRFRDDEWNDNISYFIDKKLCVRCRLKNRQWESGQIQSTSGDKASVLLSDGSVIVPIDELLPANPDTLQGVDDLVRLCYLNEPSVLHNLQYRYAQDRIYTKAGPVLIAVNPFKEIQLYGDEVVTGYRQKLLDSPHIYSIADTAYNQMMEDELNQSIIISGESGSGKTETAKFAIEYLAMISRGNNHIESELLQTNCILEAFGNAKTPRNNNASRFGKLIQIYFSVEGGICGANVQTFLLEKSRAVQLAHGERSYHIFYQLCAGAPSALRGKLKLKGASEYKLLNQSDCLVIHDVDDAKKFHMLVKALNTVRISERDQEHAFQMVAAVLWLGNITFQRIDNESHVEVLQSEAVVNAASLMGYGVNEFMLALSTRKMKAGKDEVVESLTMQQAIDARDALAKFIYANLFNWIVDKVNKSLAMGKEQTGRSINILDIYGFESFEKNGFEQFCINYANERLQQHFNRHLFKLEQEEFELDGIDWMQVDFQDNQECLGLFEKKPIGLISLLDEESNIPKATDLTFANKLRQHLKANPCYKGDKEEFGIRHYAGEVMYDTSGFLEKNRDTMHSDIIQLLSSNSENLPNLFASSFANQYKKTANPSTTQFGMSDLQNITIASKFKDLLFKLMQQLESTIPHFIRCIKPNNKQVPGMYNYELVLEQLRCYALLELVRISRSGYPTRMTHQEFCKRYGLLLPEDHESKDPLSTSVAILQQYDILPETYQVGYTKLYFHAGQIATLEDVRKQILQGTLEVQKCYSGHHARRHFHELERGVIILQSFVRGEIARRLCKGKVAKKENGEQLVAVVQIQSAIRCRLAHRHLNQLQSLKKLNQDRQKPVVGATSVRKTSEVKDLPAEILPSVVEGLERRVLVAEATLEKKEKENTILREQVNILVARWSDYEVRMRSMEETWQKQMASLQASLAAAKKSLSVDNGPGKLEGSPSPCGYDSEDTSMGTHTPGGSTPIEFSSNGLDGGNREISGGLCVVNYLNSEFELQKQNFDDEVMAISELKSGQLHSTNPAEDFRRLRHRFEEWKKDYKARLKETKAKLHKLGYAEAEKTRRRWWGKKSKP